MELKIVHLYPEEMNIYGDLGNILALRKRCEWRDIAVTVTDVGMGKGFELGDLYFMGGGQDDDMYGVFDDMLKYKKAFLRDEVDKEKVFLLICGAFQLFGEYFLDAQNRTIEGLGILPVKTEAPGDALNDRCLGNIVTTINTEFLQDLKDAYPCAEDHRIVGFENHGGQTFFTNKNMQAFTKVLYGKGNNAREMVEGGRYKNVFGSYTHGSLLPKNPHIADMLILLALRTKYGSGVSLNKLEDQIEWDAHKSIINRLI